MSISAILFPGNDIFDLTAEIIRNNREEKKQAKDEKRSLIEKLEKASGEEIFKYMNLISFANMDEFAAEARLHAQQSFKVCLFLRLLGL